MAYQATKLGYKYGKPENRPAKITNPNNYGALCKHLTSMLSNKKWLQQVAGTLMDYVVDNIDRVNKFLRTRPGEELTIPDELARRNAKKGFYAKLFKDKDNEESNAEDVKNNDTSDNSIKDTKQEPINGSVTKLDKNDETNNEELEEK